eukprot:jgi/Psemu1/824/gm1.824_g
MVFPTLSIRMFHAYNCSPSIDSHIFDFSIFCKGEFSQDNNSDDVSDPRQEKGNKTDEGNNNDGTWDNDGDGVSHLSQDKGSKSGQGNNRDGNLDNKGDDVSDPRQGRGNKSDEGNDKDGTLDNDRDLKPKVKPTTSNVQSWSHSMNAQSQNGNNNKLEQCVMLKDPDPEILYSIDQIGQKVVYVGDINCIRLYGKAQHNNKENLLWDEDSNSSSDSNNTSDNDKGLEYDPAVDGNSESKEEDECY